MRIISGKYKGKKMEGYEVLGTRPTMDRVKESIFAMIQTKLKNSVCLDLFAGSGSLGFEAVSNGASVCYLVDHNPKIIELLEKNKMTIEEPIYCMLKEYGQALQEFQMKGIQFDLIFLDPPYHENLINPSIQIIENNNLLKEDGLLICEYEREQFTSQYTCIKEKRYGTKWIRIYQNLAN